LPQPGFNLTCIKLLVATTDELLVNVEAAFLAALECSAAQLEAYRALTHGNSVDVQLINNITHKKTAPSRFGTVD
jgi:hypothetical protein